MKVYRIGFIVFMLLMGFIKTTKAQNLVQNPSFELIQDCDLYFDQFDKVNSWQGYRFTPDVFSTCSSSEMLSIPYNSFDHQAPASGKAYAGILSYHRDFDQELIGTKLSKPLKLGEHYTVSFKVSRAASHARFASDNIGILFTNDPQSSYHCQRVHINAQEVISESEKWHTISGNFRADSTYHYLVIGNFFPKTQTNLLKMEEGAFEAAYYFIDDVSVTASKIPYLPPTVSIDPSKGNEAKSGSKLRSDSQLKMIRLQGKVLDAESKKPLASVIELLIPDFNSKINQETSYEDGQFMFFELMGNEVSLKIQARNYFTSVVDLHPGNENNLEKIFYLNPLRAGQEIDLKQISFAPEKAKFKAQSFEEINRIIQMLHDNPLMKLELRGYTDQSSHLNLQNQRAEALKDYLVKVAKLKPDRLKVAEALLRQFRKSEAESAADEMRENEGLMLKILN